NAHIKRKAKRRLKHLDQEVAVEGDAGEEAVEVGMGVAWLGWWFIGGFVVVVAAVVVVWVVAVAAAVVVTLWVVAARGGEWYGGSNRSGDGDHFWVHRKRSPEKFSDGDGDGGWPKVVVAGRWWWMGREREECIGGEVGWWSGITNVTWNEGRFSMGTRNENAVRGMLNICSVTPLYSLSLIKCSLFLAMDCWRIVLPDVVSAYATIFSEESYRVASGSVSDSYQRNQTYAFVYNVPNIENFQKGQSFNTVPRPNNLNNNKQSGGSGLVCEIIGKNVSNDNVVGSGSSSVFTNEQMATLISLIKDNKVEKNVQANMTRTYINNSKVFNENSNKFFCSNTNVQSKVIVNGKIVDSGANKHMTNSDKELDNVYDISHFKIKVGHLNGTEAFISKIENLKLPNGLILLPSFVLNGKSPYEMIYKRPHTLSHLRVFGSLCFATIVNNHDKFGSRYEKCVMMRDMNIMDFSDDTSGNDAQNKDDIDPMSNNVVGAEVVPPSAGQRSVVARVVPSSPKSVHDFAPSDEVCKTLLGSLASTKDPRDNDPFLLGIEKAYSSRDALCNLFYLHVQGRLDGLTLTELLIFMTLRGEVVVLKNQQFKSACLVSKLKADLKKAKREQGFEESQLVCDLRAEKAMLCKDISTLQGLAKLAESSWKIIEDDLELLLVRCRRSQALREVASSSIGLELEDINDFNINAEESYDRVVDAFSLVKFPYVDLFVHYVGQSVGKLMTLKPSIIPFENASVAGPSASPFL
nr:ribonuclease H-like domain-containing protein [Tanacetum cinerariifolium]